MMNVRDGERQGSAGCGRQLSALDRGEMLAQRVQTIDRQARIHCRACRRDFVFQRHTVGRRAEHRRGPSRQQHENGTIGGPARRCKRERAPSRLDAHAVRKWMRRIEQRPSAWQRGRSVRRSCDDCARDRFADEPAGRSCHGPRGLTRGNQRDGGIRESREIAAALRGSDERARIDRINGGAENLS
jgi:hypothetical protein